MAATFQFKSHGKAVRALELDEIRESVGARELTVYDINEQAEVTYIAIPFNKLMEKVYGAQWRSAEEVLFTCVDGYQPSLPRRIFSEYEPYLAFGKKGDSDFTLTNKLEGSKKVKLAPYYLVWDTSQNKRVLDESSSLWPYQIASVDLVSFEEKYPRIFPPGGASKSVLRGFSEFRTRCLSCHAINGDGGKVGPELNYPTNVSEMFRPEMLKKWLSDPASMRWRTAMPGVSAKTPQRDRVIVDILAYLDAMKAKKIAPDAK